MLTSHQTLDMTPIGMIFHIKKTPAETHGQALEMEWELLPKADGPPVHIHPLATETYMVLEGQLEVSIDGQWKTLQQGEELTVNKGVPHTFRNPTHAVSRIYNTHSPGMKFDRYFEALSNIITKTKLSSGHDKKLKMSFEALIYLSMLTKKYKEETVTVNPPNFIVSVLNAIGKMRGFKVS